MKRIIPKPLRYWIDSVRGLITHVRIHGKMQQCVMSIPIEKRGPAMEQLRQQEGMIGHCFLHVICVYPPGSGFLVGEDEDERS